MTSNSVFKRTWNTGLKGGGRPKPGKSLSAVATARHVATRKQAAGQTLSSKIKANNITGAVLLCGARHQGGLAINTTQNEFDKGGGRSVCGSLSSAG